MRPYIYIRSSLLIALAIIVPAVMFFIPINLYTEGEQKLEFTKGGVIIENNRSERPTQIIIDSTVFQEFVFSEEGVFIRANMGGNLKEGDMINVKFFYRTNLYRLFYNIISTS